MRMFFAIILLSCAAACAPASTEETAPTPAPPAANVQISADPAPPFTYWAPEGSVIVNHPNADDVWFAERDGQRVATYFGDQCGASELQRFIGQPLASATSALPADARVRTICTSCARTDDLLRDRINIVFDDQTQAVREIACY